MNVSDQAPIDSLSSHKSSLQSDARMGSFSVSHNFSQTTLRRPPRVAFINLGCRVNRVETDVIASELERAGCEVVDIHDAEAIVVNTCAVTGEAEAKTRKTVRKAAHLSQVPFVVATGCVASLHADTLAEIADNVHVETNKAEVAACVLHEFGCIAGSVDDAGELIQTPTPTGRTRPGIKVQDGCNNRCSFCIVWKARGPARSYKVQDILSQVRASQAHGAHEVVLTGINLGDYRIMHEGKRLRLPDLLQIIMRETTIERIRLSSIEPPDVTDELLQVIASSNGRIAPFLHICLQSGCDATLKRMKRNYTTQEYKRACMHARELIGDVALGCDLIVGFPGETEEEFQQSFDFCKQIGFAKMHIFRYSKRTGTPAAIAEGQVDPHVMAERSRKMHELAQIMRKAEAEKLIGKRDRVVVQTSGYGITQGLFDVHIDKRIPPDTLVDVEVVSVMNDASLIVRVSQ